MRFPKAIVVRLARCYLYAEIDTDIMGSPRLLLHPSLTPAAAARDRLLLRRL